MSNYIEVMLNTLFLCLFSQLYICERGSVEKQEYPLGNV